MGGDTKTYAELQALLARLTADRAGYLDELDAANIPADLDTVKTATLATVSGRVQEKATTINLNQPAGDYPLFTGTTQAVRVESLIIRMSGGAVGGAVTFISIQTDDATPQVFITSVQGAVANLTNEAQLFSVDPIYIKVGKHIKLTIGGGPAGVDRICDVALSYRAVVSGGILT